MFNIDYDSYDEVIENVKMYDTKCIDEKRILPLNLTIDDLDMFCQYSMSMNDSVTHASLSNMNTMFAILDRRPFMINDVLKARVEFINLALEARLELNLTSKNLIKSHILRNCDNKLKEIIEEDIIKNVINEKISDTTCKYINTIVYENLVDGYSLVYSKKLNDLFDKKENGYYKRLKDFTTDFKKLMSELDLEIRKSEEFIREGRGFDLSSDNIKHKIKSILKVLRSPSNKLQTGIQYLNRMLNGGFESGRSYLLMGVTNVGKSIILLSIAIWIKKYNKLPKIEGMDRQAVLFISQENSEAETFERLFNINITGDDIRQYSDEMIEELFCANGLSIDPNNKDEINFIFKYYNDKEIGVDDIDSLISDYAREGTQIIAVVQDYIERLSPKHKSSELRFNLGSIATELSELAKKWNVPVITAAQLNRMASSIIDNSIVNNKKSTTKLLGKQNISESWDMMKNVDAAIIINREIDDTGDTERQYMGFKLEKFRGKPAKDRLYLFVHPFDENNGILLTPDVDKSQPLSRLSIDDFNPMNNSSLTPKGKPVFTDFDMEDNLIDDLKDLIDESYSDSESNYIDIYKQAEKVSSRMRKFEQIEKDIREKRELELKNDKNLNAVTININGYDIKVIKLTRIKKSESKYPNTILIGPKINRSDN